jgi:neurotrimin
VVGAPVGTEIILRCSIQASPKPMTFWMRKEGKLISNICRISKNKIPKPFFISNLGAMIVPSMKYNISEVSLNDYHFVSTLHIKSLNKNDFAQYVCVAKNTIGKSEEMIKIYGNFVYIISNVTI